MPSRSKTLATGLVTVAVVPSLRAASPHFTKIRITKFRNYVLFGSSSECEVAHPKSSEQNRARANEDAKDATSPKTVSEARGSRRVSPPCALHWRASCERLCYILAACVIIYRIHCLHVSSGNEIVGVLFLLAIFGHSRTQTPIIIPRLWESSDSLFDLSVGTQLFVTAGNDLLYK